MFHVCLCYAVLSVPFSLAVTCWEMALDSLVCCVYCVFVTFPYVYWPKSELIVRLVPFNMFNPSSNLFYWPFQGGGSLVDHFCYLWIIFVFVMLSCLFLAALWSPAGKGLSPWLSCVWCFLVFFVTFPYGGLGQVCYLIVSIPDLCLLL